MRFGRNIYWKGTHLSPQKDSERRSEWISLTRNLEWVPSTKFVSRPQRSCSHVLLSNFSSMACVKALAASTNQHHYAVRREQCQTRGIHAHLDLEDEMSPSSSRSEGDKNTIQGHGHPKDGEECCVFGHEFFQCLPGFRI